VISVILASTFIPCGVSSNPRAGAGKFDSMACSYMELTLSGVGVVENIFNFGRL